MGVVITTYPDRDSWLLGRNGIGASEIGSVMGAGFKTSLDLWRQKTGLEEAPDLSENARVQFGNLAEPPLRDMFRLMHPEYELEFTPFMVMRQEGEYSFLFDTPDGLLTEKSTGRRGLYESKTSTCISRADWDKWNCRVPDGYLYQVSQGMFCGDLEFAVIWALLLDKDGDGTLRAYHFERSECEGIIHNIKREGSAFWRCVKERRMPPQKIVF